MTENTCYMAQFCQNRLQIMEDLYQRPPLAEGSLVLVEERRQHVLDLIVRKGFVSLADLARSLEVSESTLRRDLAFWQERGQLKRIHGGAMFTGDEAGLPPLEERVEREMGEKQAIAR